MNGHIEIGGITPTRYFFSIAILLGLLFAMTSIDQEKPAGIVFLQWQLQTVVPMALLIGAHLMLLGSRFFIALNPWIALLVSGVIGASLFTPLALAIEVWLEVEPLPPGGAELLHEWLSVTPPVTLSWLALNAPWLLGYRLEKPAVAQPADDANAAAAASRPEFLTLVPAEKNGRLLMLKSELHYLQVVTDRGSSLILYKLADAVAQLPQDYGMSVHRSYWVALDAVDECVRRGRQGELRLCNGQRVPISRNRLAGVCERLAATGSD